MGVGDNLDKNNYRERAPWGDYVHRAGSDRVYVHFTASRRCGRWWAPSSARRSATEMAPVSATPSEPVAATRSEPVSRRRRDCAGIYTHSNNLPEEQYTVDATSTAYLNSSSRSSNEASSHKVADANARAQSMATPREFTMHSFVETGDAYSSIASTR